MKVTEEAEEFLKGNDILDGHIDTERAKGIVRGLLTEIERLKNNIKMKNTRLKLMKADKEYWRNLWLATLEENDD